MNATLILRLGVGICFLGHGILALTAKAKFITLLSTFGIEAEMAISILKIIGLIDIAVGLMIIFKPSQLVIKWAMAWTLMTIIAWFFHGDSIMDLMRRAPFFAAPFALLALLYGKASESKERTKLPTLSADVEGEKAIAVIDFSKICMKLMDKKDGEGWSKRQCEEVETEYRRYLKLNLLYPDENIVPNLAIDTFWHYHILDTEAYQRDCHAIYGKMLHHYPYFGMEGKADEKNFVNSFDQTKLLYEKTFERVMGGPNYLPSFQ